MRVIAEKQIFIEISKDRGIESLKRRIQSLDENRKIKNDNTILLGKLASK